MKKVQGENHLKKKLKYSHFIEVFTLAPHAHSVLLTALLALRSMKLVWSALFKTGSQAAGKEGPVILSSAKELSSFSYFQRSSVNEMFTFFARTFANNQNLTVGARTSVKQQGFQCHMYVSPAGVTAVCYADDEYPARVAFGYLSKLCEDFSLSLGGQPPPASNEDNCVGAFQVCAPARTRPASGLSVMCIELWAISTRGRRTHTQSCLCSSRTRRKRTSSLAL